MTIYIIYVLIGGLVTMAMSLVLIFFQLRELHKTMNSRLDELIKTAKLLARAEGYKEGQENHLKRLRDFKE